MVAHRETGAARTSRGGETARTPRPQNEPAISRPGLSPRTGARGDGGNELPSASSKVHGISIFAGPASRDPQATAPAPSEGAQRANPRSRRLPPDLSGDSASAFPRPPRRKPCRRDRPFRASPRRPRSPRASFRASRTARKTQRRRFRRQQGRCNRRTRASPASPRCNIHAVIVRRRGDAKDAPPAHGRRSSNACRAGSCRILQAF